MTGRVHEAIQWLRARAEGSARRCRASDGRRAPKAARDGACRGWRLLLRRVRRRRAWTARFVRRFIELAGGAREARIAVVPTASEERADTIARYEESFELEGVQRLDVGDHHETALREDKAAQMRKDVREFIRRLEAAGLTVEPTPGHYHVLRDGKPLRKQNGMPFTLPFSPDTVRWRRTAIVELRKLGIDI